MALLTLSLTAGAQVKLSENVKLSGYGMLQYQANDKKGAEENAFNLRLMRVILDGKINDFDWRMQVQGTSNAGPGNPTMQLVDLYAEWNKYKAFRVRAGQFKRAFTFENPTHPITQGWYSYAMVINNLSGFGDRTGEKSSGGRDIGLQVQGDVLKTAGGRSLLHYQVGVYNGEGINQKDKDNRKDIIGGIGLRVDRTGHLNGNGKVDIEDVTILQRHFAEFEFLTDAQTAIADFDGNGVIDLQDATAMQRNIAEFS